MGTVENPRIGLNDDESLDEFVATGVTVHFERMGDAQFWMSVTFPDGRWWDINCGAVNQRAKGYSILEENI